MKLLLASSGFTNEAIIQACEELVGESRADINFLILNEAIKVETGDHRWLIEGLQEIATNFGGTIETVDLQAHPLEYVLERIQPADAIFCFGGNTDYLTKVFQETSFAEVLPKILEQKVWVGSSAGSCVLCHKESKNTTENIFMEKPFTDQFLNLIPIFFLPHYHSEWFPQLKREVALYESQNTDLPVYLMSDQSALMITGDKDDLVYRPIGQDYLVAQHGKVLQEQP